MPTRRQFLASVAGLPLLSRAQSRRLPNFVVILLDDSGYSDFHPFGDPAYRTPNVEHLASQGCQFRNFYVTQAVCSASRSSLLSGCWPGRTKVFGAHPPGARGLDPKYATVGEVLKPAGYRTAVFGKWHIGDQPDTRPPARGFDESCGLMYSNDMWEFHPQNPKAYEKFPLHFWENGKVKIERITPKEQPYLTTWYTEHAVDFIQRQKDNPFLLYLPHSMPHVPIFASEKFKGKSGAGLYGDVMMEIDWSVGEVMRALNRAGLDDNTFVFFSSDNGPWLSYGNHAGKTPFREGKLTGFDGGTRSACIVRYPGQIASGTVSKRCWCTVDMLPMMARLAGAALPKNEIDGKDVWDLIRGAPGAKNPHNYYPFSTGAVFEGVVSTDGHWKMHIPHDYQSIEERGKDGDPGKYRLAHIPLTLYDMENDPLEQTNVLAKNPDVSKLMLDWCEEHRREFYPNQLSPIPDAQHITIPTQDGGTVYADVYGSGERGVVLVHGGQFDKIGWEPQAHALVAAGFRVIAIDLRGYGFSHGPGQTDVFSAPLHLDVLAAVRYLHQNGAQTVSVVGASLGAGAASDAVVEAESGEIHRLVGLGGFVGDKPVEKINVPKLVMVARNDTNGAGPRLPEIRKAFEKTPDPKQLIVLEGAAHAQFLFGTNQGERVMQEMVKFLTAE